MERQPCESESIYDFDYLLAKRKETVRRGQTYDVDEEGEPVRPLCRPKIDHDNVRLPPLVPGNPTNSSNKPSAGRNTTSRRTQLPDTHSASTMTKSWPKKDLGRRTDSGFLPDINSGSYNTRKQHDTTGHNHGLHSVGTPNSTKHNHSIGTSHYTKQDHGTNNVKATPSDILISYKDVEAEKKREWDLKYERMMRERQEMREMNKRNTLYIKGLQEADKSYPDAIVPATHSTSDFTGHNDSRSKHRAGGQKYGHVTQVDVSTSEKSKASAAQAGTKTSFNEYSFPGPSDTEKAEWDRRFDDRLTKRDQPAKESHHGSMAPPAHLARKGDNSSWNPQSSLPAPTIHGHAPMAPPNTQQSHRFEQSYSKQRRILKPGEVTSANTAVHVPKPPKNNLSRYRSPTDFMENFDTTLSKAKKMERKFDAIRAEARRERPTTTEDDDSEDPDKDFLSNLDDILANIDIACGRSK